MMAIHACMAAFAEHVGTHLAPNGRAVPSGNMAVALNRRAAAGLGWQAG